MPSREVKPTVIYRRQIVLRCELHERERLIAEATNAGLSLQQYMRMRLGLGRDLKKRAQLVERLRGESPPFTRENSHGH